MFLGHCDFLIFGHRTVCACVIYCAKEKEQIENNGNASEFIQMVAWMELMSRYRKLLHTFASDKKLARSVFRHRPVLSQGSSSFTMPLCCLLKLHDYLRKMLERISTRRA